PIQYNGAGQPTYIAGFVKSAEYQADGSIKNFVTANNETTSFTQSDTRKWLDEIKVTNASNAEIMKLTHQRDARGSIYSISGHIGIPSNTTDHSKDVGWTYAYDAYDQLQSATGTGIASSLSESFTIDATGNILTKTSGGTTKYYHYPMTATQPYALQSVNS